MHDETAPLFADVQQQQRSSPNDQHQRQASATSLRELARITRARMDITERNSDSPGQEDSSDEIETGLGDGQRRAELSARTEATLPHSMQDEMTRLLADVERLQAEQAEILCDVDFLQAEARFRGEAHDAQIAGLSREIRLLHLANMASAVVIQYLSSQQDPQVPTKRLHYTPPAQEDVVHGPDAQLGVERVPLGKMARDGLVAQHEIAQVKESAWTQEVNAVPEEHLEPLRVARYAKMSPSMENVSGICSLCRSPNPLNALGAAQKDLALAETHFNLLHAQSASEASWAGQKQLEKMDLPLMWIKPSHCWNIVISVQLALLITLTIFYMHTAWIDATTTNILFF
ncbi:hypothetical protein B0H14DRAFT_3863183 [Mycena olivaceomarginata]|nr:hypothetical protein B0H14DRAFT_3863183 [Mycena olivaceomarginata]